MSVPRRFWLVAWGVVGLAALGVVLTMVTLHGPRTAAAVPGAGVGPKVVVDRPHRDLGAIESLDDFAQTFMFHNVGDAPLTLARGPSTCKCTITSLPETPIPPGGKAEVHVGFSEAAKLQTIQKGAFSRGMTVLSNDPTQEKILLGIDAVIHHQLAAEPGHVTLSLNAADLAAEKKRTGETLVFSQRWKQFALTVGSNSLRGATCRLEALGPKDLGPLEATSGYRVQIVLPTEMPDGHFAGTVDFLAKVAGPGGASRHLQLPIEGRIDGRVSIFGPKIDNAQILRLGLVQRGAAVGEKLLLKVSDPQRRLHVRRIECEPEFLRVRLTPYQEGSAKLGLYRLDVEIPRNAPSCNYSGAHLGAIRLLTDHVHLPTIELKVDFSVINDEDHTGAMADR